MQEPTLSDVLDAVNKGFTDMEGRFQDLKYGVEGRLDRVEGRLTTIETKIHGLTTAVDGFAGRQLKFEAELAANQAAHERFDERLTKIENRA